MRIWHVLGSLMLVSCLCRDAKGQLTNSSAGITKAQQSLLASNGVQSVAIEIPRAPVLTDPTNVGGLLRLGLAYYRDRAFEEAIAPLEKAAFLQPTNYKANLYLGYSHYHLKQFEAAVVAFRAAAQCLPATAEAHYWLGATLYCLNRYDESVAVLRRTLVLDPNHPSAWFVLGSCQFYQKAYQSAAESFHQSALKEPTNYSAHIWVGYSLIKADRFDQAASAFQRATSLRPQDFDANFWRAISLLRLLRFQNAIPNLEQALKSKPGNREVRELLLACYLVTGQMKKIPPLHVGFFLPISILLMAFYVPTTAWLFRKSMRPASRPEPGFGFASAWWGVTMLGQIVLILVPMMLFSWSASQALGLGLILSALPLIVAAITGFTRQPWGTAFAWPTHAPDRKAVLSIFAAVLGAVVIDWGYTGLVEHIRGRPMPVQMIVQWLGSDARSWPWSIFIGVAVVAPITEEILFRGLLYAAFKKRFSTGLTILVTAALFTLMHLQPIFFMPIFALGIVLGWARHASQGLVLPVVIHCLNNSIALLVILQH